MDLFIAILKQLLVESLYPATVAELNHDIHANDKGIMLKVNGFNQKLPVKIFIFFSSNKFSFNFYIIFSFLFIASINDYSKVYS